MIKKLEEIKLKVNNINNSNIEIIKDEVDTFISTYIKNSEKKDIYKKELKSLYFGASVYVIEDDYFNPWWREKNRQSEINWFIKWRQKFLNLIKKIENFLESEINIEEKKDIKSNINIWTLNNHWSFSFENNWIQNNQNVNNQIDEIIKILDKKNIENKEEIKKILNEFQQTQDKSKLVDVFSILWNWASINSMIIALSSLINP